MRPQWLWFRNGVCASIIRYIDIELSSWTICLRARRCVWWIFSQKLDTLSGLRAVVAERNRPRLGAAATFKPGHVASPLAIFQAYNHRTLRCRTRRRALEIGIGILSKGRSGHCIPCTAGEGRRHFLFVEAPTYTTGAKILVGTPKPEPIEQ